MPGEKTKKKKRGKVEKGGRGRERKKRGKKGEKTKKDGSGSTTPPIIYNIHPLIEILLCVRRPWPILFIRLIPVLPYHNFLTLRVFEEIYTNI